MTALTDPASFDPTIQSLFSEQLKHAQMSAWLELLPPGRLQTCPFWLVISSGQPGAQASEIFDQPTPYSKLVMLTEKGLVDQSAAVLADVKSEFPFYLYYSPFTVDALNNIPLWVSQIAQNMFAMKPTRIGLQVSSQLSEERTQIRYELTKLLIDRYHIQQFCFAMDPSDPGRALKTAHLLRMKLEVQNNCFLGVVH